MKVLVGVAVAFAASATDDQATTLGAVAYPLDILPSAFVASAFASAMDNQTSPILVTDEEIAEMRKNFDSIERAHRNSDYLSTCSKDMRSSTPACHQSGAMWCWATAIAAVTQHYTTRRADQCVGLECEVVGWTFSQQCCPYEAHKAVCGKEGAYLAQIQKTANHFTGKSWQTPKGPLDQKTLDASLQAGNPVIMEVGTDKAPNHIVTLHGCNGNGKYWYHDPERNYGEYLLVDYDWLISGMCRAWITDPQSKEGARLVVCPAHKDPKEAMRLTAKWWDALYIPAGTNDPLLV